MTNFIVTTNVKPSKDLEEKAQKISLKFKMEYVERKKFTIRQFLDIYKNIMVIYKNKIVYYSGAEQLFFHPNTAMFRIKANKDCLLDIIGKEKKVILDATMGLATDSIVMSSYGHHVTALESNKIIYYIVKKGLEKYETVNIKLKKAMANIKCQNIDSYKYLKLCKDNSFDVIYFDPMFSHNIKDSDNLNGIKRLANRSILTDKVIKEAKRVAREKIVVKAHKLDEVFEKFDFERIDRQNSKFHYGFINIK